MFSIARLTLFSVFSALRAHAFCGRKLWVAAVVVFALNLLPLAADFVSLVRYYTSPSLSLTSGPQYFWATSPVTYIADGNDFGPLANVCGNETSSANSAQLRYLRYACDDKL